MTASPGTLERAALEVCKALLPIADALSADTVLQTFADFGVRFPASLKTNAGFAAALAAVDQAARDLNNVSSILGLAAYAGDTEEVVSRGVELFSAVVDLLDAFHELGTAIHAAAGALSTPSSTVTQTFGAALFDRLLNEAVAGYCLRSPILGPVLEIIGVVKRVYHPAHPTDPAQLAHQELILELGNLLSFLSAPLDHLHSLYLWGEAGFDGNALLGMLASVLGGLGSPARFIASAPGAPASLRAFPFVLTVDPTQSPPGLLGRIGLDFRGDYSLTLGGQGATWQVVLDSSVLISGGTSLRIAPPLAITLAPPAATAIEGSTHATLIGAPAEPFLLFGSPQGTRLEVGELRLEAGARVVWNTATSTATFTPELAGQLNAGALIFEKSESDGFIQSLIGGSGFRSDFALGFRFDAEHGLSFTGSAGIELRIPLNLSLGPIHIPELAIAAGIRDTGVPISVAASIDGVLGPFAVSVKDVGVSALFAPADGDGNLGLLDVSLGFKAPTGAGLAIDTTAVKGAGFLSFEPEQGRYSGVLQVSVLELVEVTAIGLVATRLPSGEDGFSLLVVISAEFTPIQLGLGFTLNGVGGLFGWNRTADVAVLRAGVRSGALDRILFPSNIASNLSQIISELGAAFPAKSDQFVAGVMAKVGWGVPALLRAEVGIAVEFSDPVRVLILGIIAATLPSESAPILNIQCNFLGVIDLSAGYISFDASLYDSHLLFMTLEGDMAFRLRWKGQSYFVLSVGGFHPNYQETGRDLPDLRRLSLNIFPGDNPRLRVEMYFAVTSNTVQLGARAEFYAGVAGFSVEGWFQFDALFQWSPFRFSFFISAGFVVRAGGLPLWNLQARLQLEGPTPWKARGTGEFSILFITISISFELQWGEARDTRLPKVAVRPKIAAAIADSRNWAAELPARTSTGITLRELTLQEQNPAEVRMHPFGTLVIRQKIAPFGIALGNYHGAELNDGPTFDVDSVRVGGQPLTLSDDHTVRDEFAPAQYFKLTDTQKVSRPSFESYRSGVRVGSSNTLRVGRGVRRTILFEETIRDRVVTSTDVTSTGAHPITPVFVRATAAGSASGRAAFANLGRLPGSALSPPRIAVAGERFTVVERATLVAVGASHASYAEALQAIRAAEASAPQNAGRWSIVPSNEVVV